MYGSTCSRAVKSCKVYQASPRNTFEIKLTNIKQGSALSLPRDVFTMGQFFRRKISGENNGELVFSSVFEGMSDIFQMINNQNRLMIKVVVLMRISIVFIWFGIEFEISSW